MLTTRDLWFMVLAAASNSASYAEAHGCDGGSTPVAYDYLINGNGIITESNCPYTSYGGATGTCHVDTAKAVL
eukprot:gene1799-1303_t